MPNCKICGHEITKGSLNIRLDYSVNDSQKQLVPPWVVCGECLSILKELMPVFIHLVKSVIPRFQQHTHNPEESRGKTNA